MEAECGFIVADAANLPATILYDAQGREVWRRLGGFEWNTPEALAATGEGRKIEWRRLGSIVRAS